MLPLDDRRWSELTHAYGSADDIPGLLDQLKTADLQVKYDTEPWYSLWSALCHQYDVYNASYAALPHIVSMAAERPPQKRLDHISLCGSIEAFRHLDDAAPMPNDLEAAYLVALRQARELTIESLSLDWDEMDTRILLGMLAVFSGKPRLGCAIFEMEEETECPNCGSTISTRGYDLFQ